MSSSSVGLSVCLSVTFAHPSQAIEIFGNVSVSFGILAICDLLIKIYTQIVPGKPSGGGGG